MATPASEDSRSGPTEEWAPPPPRETSPDERAAAAGTWLLMAADDVATARAEWVNSGSALLKCGTLFAAVCLPGWLVHAAAGATDPEKVSGYLTESLEGGGVFYEAAVRRYYALTPPSAELDWNVESTAILGRYAAVLVPSPALYVPGLGPSYWSVAMNGPADLCQAGRLAMVADIGRVRAAEREALGGAS